MEFNGGSSINMGAEAKSNRITRVFIAEDVVSGPCKALCGGQKNMILTLELTGN